MINSEVISQIYKQYKNPPKDISALNLDYYLQMLRSHHKMIRDDKEIVNEGLEEYNPFRKFLVSSLNGVLEFDKLVAFVFKGHILFFGKDDETMQVHIKPYEEKKSIWSRIFGKG